MAAKDLINQYMVENEAGEITASQMKETLDAIVDESASEVSTLSTRVAELEAIENEKNRFEMTLTCVDEVRLGTNQDVILPAGVHKIQDLRQIDTWKNNNPTKNNIVAIKLKGKPTSVEGETLSYWFYRCENLRIIDISEFKLPAPYNRMGNFLHGCKNLETIIWGNFDTGGITSMSNFLSNCRKLKSFDIPTINTSQVTEMSSFFGNCISLERINLQSWDTSSVINNANFCTHSNNVKDIYLGKAFFNCFSRADNPLTVLTLKSQSWTNETQINTMIDYLPIVTSAILQLHVKTYECITSEKMEEANNKGWDIASIF